jgi:hypothetical protein
MPQTNHALDALTGVGETPSHFDHLDMNYRIRIRGFVGICMPPIFTTLNSHLKMMPLRKKGIAQIMFYLDFKSGATPIAFGRKLTNDHTLKLYRSVTDESNQPVRIGTERLLLGSHSIIKGRARSHGNDTLGFDDGTGAIVEAGTAEILHVITKPVAAAGERQVTTVPEELRVMTEHRWEEPLPSVDGMSVAPGGYAHVDARGWQDRADVWGMPNTDINQHVNVQEYVTGGENQFSRVLHGAALPVAKHRIARARLLFRKPFFPGQAYVIRSQLYRRDNLTQMQAGFYPMEGDRPSARPSTFVVFDGEIEG